MKLIRIIIQFLDLLEGMKLLLRILQVIQKKIGITTPNMSRVAQLILQIAIKVLEMNIVMMLLELY
ncbi:hypothetical protein A7L45_09765 [Clostridium estertheticum subsp. estertheticum]|uniref:Uncharacterized protein n=1 Tax=Clostridium estertheticum subsp. estertheticum TaxID=1552 RepID=A0A1J0GG38_9CLOT|nr:hypothetical protein A7L45_09765 [Clostridium estertheticum subsp. estertheticum]